jgi:hypothetical protein
MQTWFLQNLSFLVESGTSELGGHACMPRSDLRCLAFLQEAASRPGQETLRVGLRNCRFQNHKDLETGMRLPCNLLPLSEIISYFNFLFILFFYTSTYIFISRCIVNSMNLEKSKRLIIWD